MSDFLLFFLPLIGLVVGGFVVATMVHEAGHLLCARLGSIPLRRMVIGWGPALVRGRVGDVRLEWRLVPMGAWVTCAESVSMPRRRTVVLYFLGGVLGNIVVVGLVVWLHVIGTAPTILHDAIGAPLILLQMGFLVVVQLLYIVLNLTAPLLYAARHKRYREGTTRPPISSGAWASVRIAVQLARVNRWTNETVRRAVWTALRRELTAEDACLTPEDEMLVLDTLVTDELRGDGPIVRDPALRPELDAWSQRALELGPKVKTLVASRGAALIELGRYQEGKTLLEAAGFTDGVPLLDAVLSRIFLARAEHALGNGVAARNLLMEACAIVRVGVPRPTLTAWIERIRREECEMNSHRLRARPCFGRRSLKAHAKLSLPRPRPRQRLRRAMRATSA
jgi:hypothetical protein